MAIDCHCSSCGANLRVAGKHAGRKVKCPKCAGVIAVPEADPPENLPVAKPVGPPHEQPADATSETPPATAEVIADRAGPGADSAGEAFPNIVVDSDARPTAGRRGGRRTKTGATRKSGPGGGKRVWLVAGGISAAVVAVAVAVVLIYRLWGGGAAPVDQQRSVLVLNWPANEPRDAAVFIDRRQQKLPRSGPVKFSLEPGQHRIEILRRGYEPVDHTVSLKAGQSHHYEPPWTQALGAPGEPGPTATARGWVQDMELAKSRAAGRNRDILIVFEQSDGNEKSIQMREKILSRSEFIDQTRWRFVLVRIDFPKKDEAKARVEDPQRNRRLAEHYQVSEYPTVVLTNAEGQAYAAVGYREEDDVETFVERLSRCQGGRERLDSLRLSVDIAEDDGKLAAVEEAAAELKKAAAPLPKEMELALYYGPTLNDWLTLVQERDPKNEKGAYEAVFEASWLVRLAEVDEKELKETRPIPVVKELDEWKKEHQFKDPNRAALMHLYAADRLASAEQGDEALKYAEAASGYKPNDPALREAVKQFLAALRGYVSGTGFVVAADGYILTNHHVIEGTSKNSVRLPGREEPLPAKILAQDSERDMALLKIEVPDGVELKPLQIAAAEVHPGAEIGVFGFPLGSTDVTFTWGHVGAVPSPANKDMIVLDCRVNPGNSGGPLCDTRARVAGMITAKTGRWDPRVDSYGMALPAKDLRAFLKKHLPSYEEPQAAEAGQARLEWEQINGTVSPSVVMIMKSQ